MSETNFYPTRDRYPVGPRPKRGRPESSTRFLLGLLAIFSLVAVAAIWSVIDEAVQDHDRREAMAAANRPATPQRPTDDQLRREALQAQVNHGFVGGGRGMQQRPPSEEVAVEIIEEPPEATIDQEAIARAAEEAREQAEAEAKKKAAHRAQVARKLAATGMADLLSNKGRVHPHKITRLTTIIELAREYRRVQVKGGDKQVRPTDGMILVEYTATTRGRGTYLTVERAAVVYLDNEQFVGGVSLDSAAARARYRDHLLQYEIPLQHEPEQPQGPLNLGAGL